jgi:hypothetical protein
MIEVFKTNVSNQAQANMLINKIQKKFIDYNANFDLKDCDNILRIKSRDGSIKACCVIDLLNDLGFHAEILPDSISAIV